MSREAFGDPPEGQEPQTSQPELALFFRDLRNHLLHVIDMSKGEHYLDVVRLNAQALIRRMDLLAAAQVTSDRPLTPGCRTPEGCSENGCLGWCDEHIPEVATRCEGCAELRDQLRDLTRQSNLDAMRVGKLAEDVERHSALHARLFVEKTAAQIDAENLREVLHRMLEAPTTQISAGWKDAIRRAMWAAVPDSKTPNVANKLDDIARAYAAGAHAADQSARIAELVAVLARLCELNAAERPMARVWAAAQSLVDSHTSLALGPNARLSGPQQREEDHE